MAKIRVPQQPVAEEATGTATAEAPVSAAPGTQDAAGKKGKKAKKAKVKRELFPGLWDAENETRLKLSEIPADFDPKKHKPLTRKDFDKESLFYELRARKCEEQAAKFRAMGAEADLIGGSSEKGKLKRAANMKKRFDELIAQLKEAGMTEDEINAAIGLTATKAE